MTALLRKPGRELGVNRDMVPSPIIRRPETPSWSMIPPAQQELPVIQGYQRNTPPSPVENKTLEQAIMDYRSSYGTPTLIPSSDISAQLINRRNAQTAEAQRLLENSSIRRGITNKPSDIQTQQQVLRIGLPPSAHGASPSYEDPSMPPSPSEPHTGGGGIRRPSDNDMIGVGDLLRSPSLPREIAQESAGDKKASSYTLNTSAFSPGGPAYSRLNQALAAAENVSPYILNNPYAAQQTGYQGSLGSLSDLIGQRAVASSGPQYSDELIRSTQDNPYAAQQMGYQSDLSSLSDVIGRRAMASQRPTGSDYVLNNIFQQAAGYGPNPAALQAQEMGQQAARQALAQATSYGGRRAGASLYAGLNAAADLQQQAQRTAALTSLQQQLESQGMLLSGQLTSERQKTESQIAQQQQQIALNQLYGQSLSTAAGQQLQAKDIQLTSQLANERQKAEAQIAQQQQQIALGQLYGQSLESTAAQQLQRQAQYLNQNQYLLGQYGAQSDLELQSRIAREQLAAQLYMGEQSNATQLEAAERAAKAQRNASLLGGLFGLGSAATLGAGLIWSDEEKKKNIKSADKDVEKMLNAITASGYEYKDKKNGDGKYISPMAQELEKTPYGKSMVYDTGDGKMVDYSRGLGFLMSAASNLHDRISKLEERKGGR